MRLDEGHLTDECIVKPRFVNRAYQPERASVRLFSKKPGASALRLIPKSRADKPLVSSERFFLLGNDRQLGSHLGIKLDEGHLIFGDVVLMENRFHRTFRNACFAVNAFIRVDIEHLLAFVEALHWANHDAVGVLARKTRLTNNVGHTTRLPKTKNR
jgi:hypothetical protein